MACVKKCQELGDLKAVVRALLIADKEPPTLRQFLCTYRRSEGLEFPYRQFGFPSATSFLQSMPDTVQLQQIGVRDIDVRLMPTLTWDVQHVQKLVNGQKDSSGKCNRQPLGSIRPDHTTPPPQSSRFTKCPFLPRPLYSTPALVKIKQNVRLLLRGERAGVEAMRFAQIYEEKFGRPLDYGHFGCDTVEQFLMQKLADVVHVERDSTGMDRVTLIGDGGGGPEQGQTAPSEGPSRPTKPNFVQASPPVPRPSFPVHHRFPLPGRGTVMLRPLAPGATTAMRTPVCQPVQPWQRPPSTYGTQARFPVRSSPPSVSPLEAEENWEDEIDGAPPEENWEDEIDAPGAPPEESWEDEIDAPGAPPEKKENEPEAKRQGATCSMASGDAPAVDSSPLSPQLAANIKQIVDSHPEGLWLSEFSKVYKAQTGHDLPLRDHGFRSVVDLVRYCTDIMSVTRPCPEGEFMICPRNPPPPKPQGPQPLEPQGPQPLQAHGLPAPKARSPPFDLAHVMAVIEKILRGTPTLPRGRGRGRRAGSRQPGAIPSVGSGGVTMEALQRAFVEATGFSLDPAQYGFSVPAFVRHIGRTLPAKWELLEPSGQFVITLAEPEGPGTVAPPREAGAVAPHPSVWEEAAEDLLVSLPQPKGQPKCFPKGLFDQRQSSAGGSAAQQPAVGSPGAQSLRVFSPESVEPCAPRQSPPAYAPCPPERPLVPPVELEGPFQMRDGLSTESSPVFVSHIYSAHHFYIQHMDGDTARILEWLRRDLEAACTGWYQSLITAEDLSAGMPCVAPYTYHHGATIWLRGVVYGFDAEDDRYAHVFFVDYGCASRVPKAKLHHLRNEFASVPAQAIRATMGHLKPVGADWTLESTGAFTVLIGEDRTVMCTLLERCGSICSVHLCNTFVEPALHIPDALVELGHASPGFVDEELGVLPAVQQAALQSPAGQPTLRLATLQGPASLRVSHAPHVVAPDGPQQHCEGPGLPEEPGVPLQALMRPPSPEEPALSLLPLASGGHVRGRPHALRSTPTPSEGSGAGEEPAEQSVWEDLGALQGPDCGLSFLGWWNFPSPPRSVSDSPLGPMPSTGGPFGHVPVDIQADAGPRLPVVVQQGPDAPGGAAWPEEEEAVAWESHPLTQPEPGLGSLYPPFAIKLEYLKTGHCLAVVNLQQEPYVSSANICQLLGWHSDTLLQELQARQITFHTLVLRRDNCVRLFNQMASYEVPGVAGPICLAPEVTFFQLENVSDFLNLFDNTDNLLRSEVDRVLRAFNPLSSYWTTASDDDDDDDPVEMELERLQARRKDLHRSMLTGDPISDELVDELYRLEERLRILTDQRPAVPRQSSQ